MVLKYIFNRLYSPVDLCHVSFQTLRLSQKSLSQTTTGKIVNLGSTDVLQLDLVSLFFHIVVSHRVKVTSIIDVYAEGQGGWTLSPLPWLFVHYFLKKYESDVFSTF